MLLMMITFDLRSRVFTKIFVDQLILRSAVNLLKTFRREFQRSKKIDVMKFD